MRFLFCFAAFFGFDGNVANAFLEAKTDGFRCFGKDHEGVFVDGTNERFQGENFVFLYNAEENLFIGFAVPAQAVQNRYAAADIRTDGIGDLFITVGEDVSNLGLIKAVIHEFQHTGEHEGCEEGEEHGKIASVKRFLREKLCGEFSAGQEGCEEGGENDNNDIDHEKESGSGSLRERNLDEKCRKVGDARGVASDEHQGNRNTDDDTAEERAEDRIFRGVGKRTLENAEHIRSVNENGGKDDADDRFDTEFESVKMPEHENERYVDQEDHQTGRQAEHNVERRCDCARAADKDLTGNEEHIIRHAEKEAAGAKITDVQQNRHQLFGLDLFHKNFLSVTVWQLQKSEQRPLDNGLLCNLCARLS